MPKEKKEVEFDLESNEVRKFHKGRPTQEIQKPKSSIFKRKDEVTFTHKKIRAGSNLSKLDPDINGLEIIANMSEDQLRAALRTLPKDHKVETIYFNKKLSSENIENMLHSLDEIQKDTGKKFDRIYDFHRMAERKYKT